MTRRTAMVGVNRNAISQLAYSGTAPSLLCEERELWEAKHLDDWLAQSGLTGVRPVFFDYQHETPRLASNVVKVLRDEHVNGVLPGLEYAVESAAYLAARLGLPGAGESAARILRNKVLLREATQGRSWGAVGFRLASSASGVADFLADQPGDVVVKPIDRQASLGVVRLTRGDDVEAALSQAVVGHEPNQTITGWSSEQRVLVEQCLVGDECSVEALVSWGEVVWANLTAKRVRDGNHRVEVGHEIVPLEDWCRPTMQELVDAVGFGDGLLHAEFMRTTDGPRLIECAGRPPGDQILNLIEHAWGFSPAAAWSEIMCGRRPELPATPTGRAAIAFVWSAQPGVVKQLADLAAVPARALVNYPVTVGQEVRPPRSSWDRLGFVLVASNNGMIGDYAEARRIADSLRPSLEAR